MVFIKDFCDLLPNCKSFRMLRDGLVALDPYASLRCELFAFQNFAFQNIVALPSG
jgi:hypothetical protein